MTDTRARILEIASLEVGPQVKGSRRVYEYWRDVLPPEWTDAQVKLYAKTKEWCGGFALWCLRAAGIAQDVHWHDGIGFLGPAHLKPTRTPSRGDVGVKPIPFAHHWIFKYEYDGWLYGIGGNTPGVKEQRFRRDEVTVYSISPLLDSTDRDTDPPPAPAHPHTTIREGMTGGEVRYLQSLLPGCKVDGSFGPKTRAFVVMFQSAAGLTADGVVGPKTWIELEEGKT